jgi:flagellar motor protein MotB
MTTDKPRVKIVENIVTKKGAPAYMVSFGDMMTLILCFFILLVALSKERQFGLLAKGLGSFVIAVKSHGLNGVLSGHEEQGIFDQMRRRFNLPPEPDPERRTEHELASSSEMVRAEMVEALEPRRELHQPRLAAFAPRSAQLDQASRDYLASLAESLRPAPGQLLILEGHAPNDSEGGTGLAYQRAQAVARHLIEKHRFKSDRVSARAWLVELGTEGGVTDAVNARLVFPPTRED